MFKIHFPKLFFFFFFSNLTKRRNCFFDYLVLIHIKKFYSLFIFIIFISFNFSIFQFLGFSPEEQRAQQDLSAVRDQEDAKLAVQQQELDKEAQNIVIATIQVPMHVPKKETNGINVQQHQDQRESIAPSEITTDKSNGVLSKSGKDLNAKLPQMFVTSTDNVQMDLPCTVDEKDLDRLVSESYPDDDMNSYRPLAGSRMEAARNMRKKLLSRNSSRYFVKK